MTRHLIGLAGVLISIQAQAQVIPTGTTFASLDSAEAALVSAVIAPGSHLVIKGRRDTGHFRRKLATIAGLVGSSATFDSLPRRCPRCREVEDAEVPIDGSLVFFFPRRIVSDTLADVGFDIYVREGAQESSRLKARPQGLFALRNGQWIAVQSWMGPIVDTKQ
jgi:hypothetical protein